MSEQLIKAVERLQPPLLDRERPPWRYTLIEGLAGGHAVLHNKSHHACMDGIASQELLRRFYSRSPERGPTPPVSALPREPEPSAFTMLREAYSHMAEQPGKALRALPQAAKGLLRLGMRALEDGLPHAPRTRFDVTITAERSCAIATLPFDGVRAIARSQGATINDVVMALSGQALRRYLADN